MAHTDCLSTGSLSLRSPSWFIRFTHCKSHGTEQVGLGILIPSEIHSPVAGRRCFATARRDSRAGAAPPVRLPLCAPPSARRAPSARLRPVRLRLHPQVLLALFCLGCSVPLLCRAALLALCSGAALRFTALQYGSTCCLVLRSIQFLQSSPWLRPVPLLLISLLMVPIIRSGRFVLKLL